MKISRQALHRCPRVRGYLVATMAVIVAATAAVVPSNSASAASNGKWSIFPSIPQGQTTDRPYFAPVLSPGVGYEDSVTITNQSTVDQVFNLYSADAFNTNVGAFSLRRRTDPRVDLGAWIDLPLSTIDVPARHEVVVPFTIDPPADAAPGAHNGGIVAEATTGPVTKSGAVRVTVLQAVGVRVYGRVRGPLHPGLSVGSVALRVDKNAGSEFGAAVKGTITYSVTNTGNTNVTPTAALTVSPLVGSSLHLPVRTLPQLLPHGSATVSVPFSSIVPFGRLDAHVVASTAGMTATGSSSVLVIPWVLLLIVLAVVVAIWRARRRRGPRAPVSAVEFFARERHAPRRAHAVRT